MRKTILFLAVMVLFLSPADESACRRPKQNLYVGLSEVDAVNTYIAPLTDSSGQAADMLDGISKHLDNVLRTRMTVNFKLVESAEDADIIIKGNVVERIWLEVDPIDQIHSAGAAAMDAMIEENYARMQIEFTVERGGKKNDRLTRELPRKLRRKKPLWEQRLQATITKGDMPEDASKPLLEERISEVLMRKCFSKNARM